MKTKYYLTFISSLLIGLLAFTTPAFAEGTPDGESPANEGVCDDLKYDGITKGLYGLCVAFCEAQDYSSISIPVTVQDFADLKASKPSGKILANYNKKKTDGDPAMPCILAAEACPCWSQDEINNIDGYMDNTPTDDFSCSGSDGDGVASMIIEENDTDPEFSFTIAETRVGTSEDPTAATACRYAERIDPFTDPDYPATKVYLFSRFLATTPEEHAGCKASVLNRQAASGMCP